MLNQFALGCLTLSGQMSQCVKNLFWMNYKIYQEVVGYFVPVHGCVPCHNFNPHIITNHIHDVFMRMVKYMTTLMSHCSEEITFFVMWWDFPVVLIMFCCSGISTHWKIEYASFFNKNFHFASERFFFHIKKNTFLVSHCFAWAIILCDSDPSHFALGLQYHWPLDSQMELYMGVWLICQY